ncbi:MAG: hypothetical protein JO071_09510, partial [Deltaproteobacteria bacterium]|nr:hypothetical protein [Deltaproteobacteria bacterium]
MDEFENTTLWKDFASKATDEQRQMVRQLVKRASQRLELIRDTFPTYTLHNNIHAHNVITLMGHLLGPELRKITPLEGAFLILSAYCHDIGMVFDDDERHNIRGEPQFQTFLSEHPEQALDVHNNKDLSADIAELYCRWCHPDRVAKFLHSPDLQNDAIKWGVTSLRDTLSAVCRSHGYDVDKLITGCETLDSTFRGGEADLMFCAIVLRLADIMDFDNTRSPEEVYKYIGVGRRTDKRHTLSDVEWLKHLASEGFRFPADRDDSHYILAFIARPDHPAVEYDIRQFLDTIENEFRKCNGILRHCSDKWRNFRLPDRIDRKDITSNGYKYGEYRFTLQHTQIINLLMGDNLYADPHV